MVFETEYRELLKRTLKGRLTPNRTGQPGYRVFGGSIRHSFINGFPLISSKFTNFNSAKHEILWFLNGGTNIKYLNNNGVHIWDAWADIFGDLGPIYGKQWKSWGPNEVDQIANLIAQLKADPFSRRGLVSAWNVDDLNSMALPPCPVLFQVCLEAADPLYVKTYNNKLMSSITDLYGVQGAKLEKRSPKYVLNMSIYQRSVDTFLGLPFDFASHGVLALILANSLDAIPGEMFWSGSDIHLYKNHEEQAETLLSRPYTFDRKTSPWVEVFSAADYSNVLPSDINLFNYNPMSYIKGDISV